MIRLQSQQLSVEYRSARTRLTSLVLNGLDFSIEAGQFAAILGPSGCGKTTLLNVLTGLLPATHGRVLLDGQEIRGPSRDRAQVFQTPALLPWRTVLENASYGLELQGIPARQAAERAFKFVSLVGLQGFEDRYPHELSTGMQQRVNLARALATEPKLLLMDEPLAALDAQSREQMQDEIQRAWLQTGTTALLVTHLISEAVYLADIILVLTPAPAVVKALVPVPLPRPRRPDMRQLTEFYELENRVRKLNEI